MDDHDLAADLDAYVAGEYHDSVAMGMMQPPDDADKANQLLRARHRLARERERITELAEAEIERIKAWREDRDSGLAGRQHWIEALLEGWMRAVNDDDPNRKTEKLPNGELWLRAPAWRVEVTDADALRLWLWEHDPELLKISVEPKAGDLKGKVNVGGKGHESRPLRLAGVDAEGDDETAWRLATKDGESVPGVRLAKANHDTFSVH